MNASRYHQAGSGILCAMLRGEAVYELLRYLNSLVAEGVIQIVGNNHLHCHTCGHHLGQHMMVPLEANQKQQPWMPCTGAQKEINRNWCDCDGFALYYCDQPRLPTAEEIYDFLQREPPHRV